MTEAASTQALRRDLDRALHRELPGWRAGSIESIGAGRSAVTVSAELAGPGGSQRTVAVRAMPAGDPGLSIATMTQQFAVLERLYRDGSPVPAPVLVVEGADDAKYDLLVTEFLAGEVPDPWRRAGRVRVAELAADERFVAEFVETLAAIHSVTDEQLPAGMARGESTAQTYLGRYLSRVRTSIAESAFCDDPVLTYVSTWIEEHDTGTDRVGGLVHGDYRMGNIVVRDGRLVGVLDWELAESGETVSDVAWLCGPQGRIEGRPAGLVDDAPELLRRYEKATGRSVDEGRFRLLTAAGTMRTAAVWVQLSVDEARYGNNVQAARRRDSVIELIGMCAAAAGLDTVDTRPVGSSSPLLDALGSEARTLVADLDDEARATSGQLTPATYNARLFLRRLDAIVGTDFAAFSSQCEGLLEHVDCQHAPFSDGVAAGPGRSLSHVIREHRVGTDSVLESQIRAVVGWAAHPAIAFANLVFARQHRPDPA